MNLSDMPMAAKDSSKRSEMSLSQSLLSKKGPLGAIWVAGYSLNRLSRDQIARSDIPSSVDKILIDERASVPYRILAYLLLGVVRVYSKKVEYVFEDCRRIINELHNFADERNASSFREVVHLQDFFISLPESYELDAFVLELADDASKQQAHIAKKEDITLQSDSFKKEKSATYVIDKYHRDVTLQQTTTSFTYKANPTEEQEADQNPPESPFETESCPGFYFHLERIISSICTEIQAETSSPEYMRGVETSGMEEPGEIRFSGEECQDFEQFYQSHGGRLGIFGSSDIIQSASFEHSDLIRMTQNETNDLSPGDDDTNGDDVIHRDEVNPNSPTTSGNSDHTTPQEKEANFCLKLLPNERGSFAAVAAVRKEKPTLTVQITPESKNPGFKGSTISSSTGLSAILTPAKSEFIRRASKRKFLFDDPTVISNRELKDTINSASGLKRKRNKVPRTTLAILRLSYANDLPQRFMEPLIPSTVIDPSDIRRKFQNLIQVETVQTSNKKVMNASPRGTTDCRLTIAPGTPAPCLASTRAFESPKDVDSDGGAALSFGSTSRADLSHPVRNTTDFAAASDEECDMNPMDEEMDPSADRPDGEERDGLSAKTRAVAGWLHETFQTRTKCNEAGAANLSGIMVGKTRKESARIFYEILVLGSKGFVDVTQKGSYGDILVRETARMEGKLAHI